MLWSENEIIGSPTLADAKTINVPPDLLKWHIILIILPISNLLQFVTNNKEFL